MRWSLRVTLLLALPIVSSCVWIIQSGSIERILPESVNTPRSVASPMKAFLLDGSTVVYANGGRITSDSVQGVGTRYAVGSLEPTPTSSIALDSVVGIEAFQGRINGAASFFATVAATAVGVVATAALAVAIFGSCPTFYSSPEQGGVLQSEAFSYSIAPLLEGRDLDALRIAPDSDGVLRLELRNEALETHYINELEMVVVDHASGARALPDDRGLPIAVTREAPPRSARDRNGIDVLEYLVASDDSHFASSTERVEAASSIDDRDWVELTFDRPDGDEAVVVLQLRNSLLTTVLFYDMMLGRAGAGAVDWIGKDMARIGEVAKLGRWFQDAMGLRVQIPGAGGWEDVGRVPDTGPIAWEEVAVRVPVPDSGPVRVRLSFFTDAWRIDRAALAQPSPIASTVRTGVARIVEERPVLPANALELMAEPDQDYLATYPGTSAMLEFDPPPARPGFERSYLLSSQGYYTEWVRTGWIRGTDTAVTFDPGDDTVEALMQLWLGKKDAFEAQFYSSRIPVR